MDNCSVCLQQPTLPTKLPCSHIFCFLCAKGAILRTQNCPLCRKTVPMSFFDDPQMVENQITLDVAIFDGRYYWYYEGRDGWWLYDAQVSMEIEKQFQNKEKTYETLIAGAMYVIDFENMVQYRKDLPHKRRRIKRDAPDQKTKGIAGLRTNNHQTTVRAISLPNNEIN